MENVAYVSTEAKLHWMNEDTTTTKKVVNDDWVVSICEAGEAAPMHTKTLLPGERMGWWSSQRFARRVRMRALLHGAVNDVRTSILLDTDIISTKLAR
ncbi:LOW QUALITY PROTEIN: Eukaryotic/viral aspartic protease [Phytophthora megakarya]|uniref:Eukaryotic/viral aspartic protease n=1 Tax=Phytophthora megakarya TaxID=4795 RepID=A0A225W905_9STRA|nr:LOW QUALITY PROTEIN: Eukaryotic/viral aspartic protease [Phytophthora megakarya]